MELMTVIWIDWKYDEWWCKTAERLSLNVHAFGVRVILVIEVLNESELQSEGDDDATRATKESTASTTTQSHNEMTWRMKGEGRCLLMVVNRPIYRYLKAASTGSWSLC
jgi:hypothetical protein